MERDSFNKNILFPMWYGLRTYLYSENTQNFSTQEIQKHSNKVTFKSLKNQANNTLEH
jgi:hypothetical protein